MRNDVLGFARAENQIVADAATHSLAVLPNKFCIWRREAQFGLLSGFAKAVVDGRRPLAHLDVLGVVGGAGEHLFLSGGAGPRSGGRQEEQGGEGADSHQSIPALGNGIGEWIGRHGRLALQILNASL